MRHFLYARFMMIPNLAQILDAITTFFSKQTIRQDSKLLVARIFVELIHAMPR